MTSVLCQGRQRKIGPMPVEKHSISTQRLKYLYVCTARFILGYIYPLPSLKIVYTKLCDHPTNQ